MNKKDRRQRNNLKRKRKLLFIHPTQFGYHTSSYEYCLYLREVYDITFLCNNYKYKKIYLENVKVRYPLKFYNKYLNIIHFFVFIAWHIFFFQGTIFVFYFRQAAILKRAFFYKKMILDVRSLAVTGDEEFRIRFNKQVAITAALYDYVTVVSEGIRGKIGVNRKKSSILPLGADPISMVKKSYDTLSLLYIGTLSGRDIYKTIEGISIFTRLYPNISLKYDIVGEGFQNESGRLKKMVNGLGLNEIVFIHGHLLHTEIKHFFDNCNFGVSFIPITDYYQFQPALKTFEYLMSGLFTIATSTKSNMEVISEVNGVLIRDTAESFAEALVYCYNKLSKLDDESIRNSIIKYQWSNIVHQYLTPVLTRFQ